MANLIKIDKITGDKYDKKVLPVLYLKIRIKNTIPKNVIYPDIIYVIFL
jgi:hypothetical protein